MTSTGLVVSDLVDIVEINITNPSTFVFAPSFTSTWDARMFLFRGSPGTTANPLGEPLCWIDNQSATNVLPKFDNTAGAITSLLAGMADPETFTAGRYLIAIGGTGAWPLSGPASGDNPSFNSGSVGLQARKTNTVTWHFPDATTSTGGAWRFLPTGVNILLAATCADAEHVTPGDWPLNNTSDTGWQAFPCGTTNWALARDVWYRLSIPCDGPVRVSTCLTFTGQIGVYTGDCDALVPVGCTTPQPGCGTAAFVEFTPDRCGVGEYLVRVGSFGASSVGGSGTVSFECLPLQPNPDVNGDGVVNGEDLTIILNGWTG